MPLDWVAQVNSGTPYFNVTSEQLRILQDRNYLPTGSHDYYSPNALLSHAEAYRSLSASFSQQRTEKQDRAYDRLTHAWNIPTDQTTPDLYIKVFNDLSSLLFDNELYTRVRLTWEDLGEDDLMGNTASRSQCNCCPPDRIHIALSRDMFYTERKSKVWGTLLHEMLHAYVMIMVDDEMSHCEHFEAACRELGRALGFSGLSIDGIVSENDV